MLKVANDCSDEALAKHARYRHAKLKDKLFSAENESDVRQAFLTLYDLDLVGNLEKYRIDWAHPEIWLEMKFSANMGDRAVRSKIIAQILHYLHQAPAKRGEHMLPETFGIVDKSYIMLYDTEAFGKYIINPTYFDGIKSPSSAHPKLERDLFNDPLIQVTPLHVLADYDTVWTELEKRGAYV